MRKNLSHVLIFIFVIAFFILLGIVPLYLLSTMEYEFFMGIVFWFMRGEGQLLVYCLLFKGYHQLFSFYFMFLKVFCDHFFLRKYFFVNFRVIVRGFYFIEELK